MDIKLIFTVLALLISAAKCSRILVLYPTISISHIIPLRTLSLALAERGHEITFVSTYPLGKKVENYRDIKVPFDEADKEFLSEIAKDPNGKSFLYVFPKVFSLVFKVGNETLQNQEMKKLMNEEKFDLVIVGFFLSEYLLGVADHFKCPSILFSPAGVVGTIAKAIGNPLGVSAVPHILSKTTEMDFIGRLKTFLAHSAEHVLFTYTNYRARQLYE